MKKNKTKTIIKKFKEKHNNKYDYSLVDYINGHTKVKILCKKHGIFEQKPEKHKMGQGCKECGFEATTIKQRSTKEEFIEKAKLKYNDIYDYSLVNYINSSIKVKILCPIHKEFEQTPNHFLRGNGCPKCGIAKRNILSKLDTNVFIKKAIKKHGNEYDYSESIYVNSNTSIRVVCKKHGPFYPRPTAHTRGSKCPICQTKRIGMEQRMPKEEFITKANEVHKGIYDYSKVIYKGNKVPITIICKKHKSFKMRPDNHLTNKQGCPVCSASKGELKIYHYLNKLNLNFIREYRLPDSEFRYDFYIPKLNILIEYDGIQHYLPIEFFGGKEGLAKQKEIDKMKNILADSHDYDLIRIPYLRINDLEKYLLFKLSKIYPYRVKDKFYESLTELCLGEHLPGTTRPKDVRHLLLYKK